MPKPFGVWAGATPFYKKNKQLDMNDQISYLEKLQPEIYCHIISKEKDFTALEDFLIQLQLPYWKSLSRLQVWPVLLPPTEGLSEPFSGNWSRWAKVFCGFRQFYPQLTGIVVDDFNCKQKVVDNLELFNKFQQEQWKQCKRILNRENIKLHLAVYETNIGAKGGFKKFRDFVEDFPGTFEFDGLLVPWMNLCSTRGLEKSLQRVRQAFPDKTLVGMVYASPTSWHRYPPEPNVYSRATQITYTNSDAIINYCIPDKGPIWNATKNFFTKWREEAKVLRRFETNIGL